MNMQINRRVTNGLAWAGLFLVVGVPAADLVSARLMGEPESIAVMSQQAPVPQPLSQRPAAPEAEKPVAVQEPAAEQKPVEAVAAAEPVKTPSAPAAKPAAASGDVVDSYLSSGKKLPSYITGAEEPAQAATTPQRIEPAPTTPAATKPATIPPATAASQPPVQPVAQDPVETASVTPQKIAPTPMPLSMRPTPVSRQLASQPSAEEIVIPEREVADYEAPVTAEDLEDWEYGPLTDFLARQERSGARSEARVNRESNYYDEDGFFLSDGPNQPPRGDRYIGPVEGEFYFPFIN
jgi:hypothetical protein